ncbi:hypothetical protein PPYR_13815 [Photinus pyralis]|uniref:Dynein regulatory complex protein 10 n=1 Tax=Photinus pyralis TaxID=7054 RepID=A0A5N4AA44_PHOPY|nr:dynein regulatory complex protein 10 [Photinus pyralis]KAB0794195.1 hypothetical protein PPYR_13815 [Photinus pyralis]
MDAVDFQVCIIRLVYIINETIEKLKIAICLPKLLDNPGRFQMRQYLETVWNNTAFKDKTLRDHAKLADPQALRLVEEMQKLRAIAADRLQKTVSEEKVHRQCLTNAWLQSARIRADIKELNDRVDEQRGAWENQLDEKNGILFSYQRIVDQLGAQLRRGVIEATRKTAEELRQKHAASSVRQSHLASDVRLALVEYQRLLSKDLRHEKALRAKRAEVQMDVVNWLVRFDADVRSAQERLEDLAAGYKEESERLEELRMLFGQQEVEYNGVLAEKEADRIRSEEEVELFLHNYSAKIIQRGWRAYRRRLIEFKKSKKGKGKGKGKQKKSPT